MHTKFMLFKKTIYTIFLFPYTSQSTFVKSTTKLGKFYEKYVYARNSCI